MLQNALRQCSKTLAGPVRAARELKASINIQAYLSSGRRPWSRGYVEFKERFIRQCLSNPDLLSLLAASGRLPAGHGEFLDERVVEYPWFVSRLRQLPADQRRVLDAGSVLNFDFVLSHPDVAGKELTIATLAPEDQCYWQRGISYSFCDLRNLPYRDGWFDVVACLSTLEHVGMDNRFYTTDEQFVQNQEADFQVALRELRRVCRPGGRIFITVPYGKPISYGWFRQFDAERLTRALAAFANDSAQVWHYQYSGGQWQRSSADSCAECVGFDIHASKYWDSNSTRDYDPDFAAASRAIAAIEIVLADG